MMFGCLRLSYVSVICRVTYLQFPIQAYFSSTSMYLPQEQFLQRDAVLARVDIEEY